MTFNIQYTNENLHSNTGLSLISKLLDSVNPSAVFRGHGLSVKSKGHSYSDLNIIYSCLGLLCLGHSNYESQDLFKSDRLFQKSLSLNRVPSKETLRQRLDLMAQKNEYAKEALSKWNFSILKKYALPNEITGTNLIPVDFDVTVMDNTGSKKEGVGQSYRPNVKGYAPMMTNIGNQGYLLNHEFRKGNAHSNCPGTLEYILKSMNLARQLCPDQKLLARFDSGNDSDKNIVGLSNIKNTYFLIKHQLRGQNVASSKQALIEYVMKNYTSKEMLDKNTVCYFAEQPYMAGMYDENEVFIQKSCRRILSVVELNNDINNGQPLLIPYRSVHMWRTNLPKTTYNPQRVIKLYKDHGTSEQFHSEFKTDLDIERLPSSKFKTNELYMTIAQVVFNLLRIVGDKAVRLKILKSNDSRIRVRIRTVMLKLILLPCKFIRRHKRWTISLPRSNPLSIIFDRLYAEF